MKYKLVLIISALSGFSISLCMHFYFYRNIDGLFINLAAVFLQILIALFLVDYLLDRNERAQWKGFEEKMRRKIVSLSNFTLLEIRGVLGMRLDQKSAARISEISSLKVNEKLYADTRSKEDDFAAYLQAFSSDQWRELNRGVRLISSEAERVLVQYFSKLTPRQLELLSEIQEHADLIVLFPEIFPNFAGDLKRDIAAGEANSIALKEQLVQRTAERMKQLVELTNELIKTV
ncbi:MAG: hypothetical protein FWE48_01480 [Coriobacteriia bacterium]|nr:hypothetical protein [Coriobacteriia bacterium]MCL2745752.1 hypothetical protein [Coriobacteriia bacterium]MCL2870535.1 hypothetical protein [Coriobacteriia bacterium]